MLQYISPDRGFYRIGDNFIFIGDGYGRVDLFDGNENLAMFYWEIHGIVWVRTAEFDGDWGVIAVVSKFNYCGMYDESFIDCGRWLESFGE